MQDDLYNKIQEVFGENSMKAGDYSALGQAYVGDAVYDVIIRTLMMKDKNYKVNELHRMTSEIVKAESQSRAVKALSAGFLTEEENAVYRRGRNANAQTRAKNASAGAYRHATGYEALLGYLYMSGRTDRILDIVHEGLVLTGFIKEDSTICS